MEIINKIINSKKLVYVIDCFGKTAPILQKLRFHGIGGYTALTSIASIEAIVIDCGAKDGIIYITKEDYIALSRIFREFVDIISGADIEYIEPMDLTGSTIDECIKISESDEELHEITYVPFTSQVYDTTVLPDTLKLGRFFNTMTEGKAVLKPSVGLPIMFCGDIPMATTVYANNNFDFKYFNNNSKDEIITMFRGTKKYRDIITDMMKYECTQSEDSNLFVELIQLGCNSKQAKGFMGRVQYLEDNNLMGELSIIKMVYGAYCKGNPLRLVDISQFSDEEVEEIINNAKSNDIILLTVSNTMPIQSFRDKYLHVLTNTNDDVRREFGISRVYEDFIGYVITGSKIIEFIIQ